MQCPREFGGTEPMLMPTPATTSALRTVMLPVQPESPKISPGFTATTSS